MELARVVNGAVEGSISKAESHWLLLANDRPVLDLPGIGKATTPLPRAVSAKAWTDDYISVLQVLSFGRAQLAD